MAPFIPHNIYDVSAKKDDLINEDNDVSNKKRFVSWIIEISLSTKFLVKSI